MTQPRIIVILLVLAAAVALGAVGCGTGDEASASTGEAGEAAEAATVSQTGEGADGDGDGDGDGDEEGEEEKKEEAVPVEVVSLERGPIESVLRFSSNLEAESAIEVFSQAKRMVIELPVEEGDRVTEGRLLLKLEDDEQQSALAKVETQLDKAAKEFERQQRLFEQELISEQDFRDATFEVEQLRIELDDARRELTYTEVRAPIAGTITERHVNLGDTVQIGEHLFDMVDFDSIVARVFVPERVLGDLEPGMPARVVASASGGHVHEVEVKRISPVVDPRTGTVKVTVDVGRRPGLRPGMYVDVDLVVDTRDDAVLVPKRALVYDDDQVFVYRVGEDLRVSRVFFSPRLTDKHHVEPVDGLDAGDRIVVAGQAGLKDGALVELPEQAAREDRDDGDAADGTAVERAAL